MFCPPLIVLHDGYQYHKVLDLGHPLRQQAFSEL